MNNDHRFILKSRSRFVRPKIIKNNTKHYYKNNNSSVTVIQADNRNNLDFLYLSKKNNIKMCELLKYNYLFINFDFEYLKKKYKCKNPKYAKIFVINEYINKTNDEIIIFLDSDAWIQEPYYLKDLVTNVNLNNTINGAYSRDPYTDNGYNTYINSGGFILKINNYVKQMYNQIIKDYYTVLNTHWTNDQFYISRFVYKNKDKFYIFEPDVLNSPTGKIIRHCWNGKKNGIITEHLTNQINRTEYIKHTKFIIEENLCRKQSFFQKVNVKKRY